jgi:hypothetical protein
MSRLAETLGLACQESQELSGGRRRNGGTSALFKVGVLSIAENQWANTVRL